MVFTGQGIFTGSLTTAGAFLAMYFTNFKGIEEMGIICGGGLLLCLIPMMTLLPVLLLRGQQNVIDQASNRKTKNARASRICGCNGRCWSWASPSRSERWPSPRFTRAR